MSNTKQKFIIYKGKHWSKELIEKRIMENNMILFKSMRRIYSFQTTEEKCSKSANSINGKGFNKFHAKIISDFIKKLDKGEGLSSAQLASARKIMKHYAGQLFEYMKGNI